jgi:hypothetical protein
MVKSPALVRVHFENLPEGDPHRLPEKRQRELPLGEMREQRGPFA